MDYVSRIADINNRDWAVNRNLKKSEFCKFLLNKKKQK